VIGPEEFDDVVVSFSSKWSHEHFEPTLRDWCQMGPGPTLRDIVAARRASTGERVPLDELPLECRNTEESRRLRGQGLLPQWGWLPPRDEDFLLQWSTPMEMFQVLAKREPRLRDLRKRARALGTVELEDDIDTPWDALSREIETVVGPTSGATDPLLRSEHAPGVVRITLASLVRFVCQGQPLSPDPWWRDPRRRWRAADALLALVGFAICVYALAHGV
jgi:hypothetical protein